MSIEQATRLRKTIDQASIKLKQITASLAKIKETPDRWSKQEILGHLIDSAANNHHKFVRTATAPGGHLEFVGYAQNQWVAVQNYQEMNWPELIEFWYTYNRHLVRLMENLPASTHLHTISIDQQEPLTLEFIMHDYNDHLEHHLSQIFHP
ncbi:MAG: DinB family protein [Saprospiraceae bacterium]|nr:DinB family protein [Saprospiraceae bacterium]